MQNVKNNSKVRWNVIKNIKTVCDCISKCKLKIEKSKKYTDAMIRLCEYFGVKEKQLWLLCISVWSYFNDGCHSVSFEDLSQFIGTNVLNIAAMNNEMEELAKKNYIKFEPIKARIIFNNSLIKYILSNQKLVSFEEKKVDYATFVQNLADKYNERRYRKKECDEVIEDCRNYEKENSDLALVQRCKRIITEEVYRYIFYDICNDFLYGVPSSLLDTLGDIFEGCDQIDEARNFLNETHYFLKKELLEFETKGNLSDSTVVLTEKGKEIFLGEDYELFATKLDSKLLKMPEDIRHKELFYSEENQKQIDSIKEALEEKKFKDIRSRLKDEGLPLGITAIFYGEPGTGKSETVYQIAKATGRAVFHVDISETKSCWFGESEKKIKKLFKDYQAMCKRALKNPNEKIPILLFNEADAVFGKRKNDTSSSTAQTENTIQNIILEEMENLNGIMIATTNLIDNLDSAFERRLLFKVKFDKPTDEAKKSIWMSKLGWLKEEQAESLSKNFSFSGGEIDNIVRKATMKEVISGERPNISEVMDMCRVEKLVSDQRKRVGFVA